MYGKDKKQLTFGIDYDDTITKNPELFKDLINLLYEHWCDIYIVTARQPNGWCEDLRQFHEDTKITVIFTGGTAKQDIAEIDIWIDDFPLAITHDFKETGWTPSASVQDLIKEQYEYN